MKYYEWLEARTTVDENILGGSRVFKGTRLSVTRVGLYPAELEHEMGEDYPFLMVEDVRHARTYVHMDARIIDVQDALHSFGPAKGKP